jgi:hypothetical protein
MDARKRHLRGALNSIEFSLELTRKTEVNQSMKYMHSSKFKAIGIALATAVAVAATATPGSATNYSRSDGNFGSDGHFGSDATGPKGSDSGHSLGNGHNVPKKEPHFSANKDQTAAIRLIISQLAAAQKQAQSSDQQIAQAGQAEFNRLLPIARQLLAAVSRPPSGHPGMPPKPQGSDSTGPQGSDGGHENSLHGNGIKNESKGKTFVDSGKLTKAQDLLLKLNNTPKNSPEYEKLLVQIRLAAFDVENSAHPNAPYR